MVFFLLICRVLQVSFSVSEVLLFYSLCVFIHRYVVGTEDGNIHKCMCSHTEQYIDSYFMAHAVRQLL